MSKFVLDFGSFWAPFWSLLGRLLGAKLAPKSDKKSTKNRHVPPGRSWGGLGRSWDDLGWSWGWSLGGLEEVLGGSWAVPARAKIDQKIDPKLDSKTGRIATEKNRSGATPVVVSAIDKAHRDPDPARLEIYLNRY